MIVGRAENDERSVERYKILRGMRFVCLERIVIRLDLANRASSLPPLCCKVMSANVSTLATQAAGDVQCSKLWIST